MRDLLEAGDEPALEQLDVIAGRLAGAQEAVIGHHHRGGEIGGEMTAEQLLRDAIGEAGAGGDRIDLVARLDHAELERRLEGARGAVEHFGQLELAGVEVEPAQAVGHHLDREDPEHELVPDPQPLDDRAVEIAGAEPQFIGQRFGLGIEIGKMVAPALGLAPDQLDRIDRRRDRLAAALQPIEGAGEGLDAARRAGQPFLDFATLEVEIGEQRIGQPAAQAVDAAGRRIGDQLARIELQPLGEAQHQRRGQRALVALDQVEIARRNFEQFGQRRLGHRPRPPRPADAMSGEDFALGHL